MPESEFEPPVPFTPEIASLEHQGRMFDYLQEQIAMWRAEDAEYAEYADNPFTEDSLSGQIVCTSCCQFYTEIPHHDPLDCDVCHQVDTITPLTLEFFTEHLMDIVKQNEGMMKSAFYETL